METEADTPGSIFCRKSAQNNFSCLFRLDLIQCHIGNYSLSEHMVICFGTFSLWSVSIKASIIIDNFGWFYLLWTHTKVQHLVVLPQLWSASIRICDMCLAPKQTCTLEFYWRNPSRILAPKVLLSTLNLLKCVSIYIWRISRPSEPAAAWSLVNEFPGHLFKKKGINEYQTIS